MIEKCLVVLPDVDFRRDPQRYERVNWIYELAIKPVVGKERLECLRAVPNNVPELIGQLGQARVIIVNLDGCDPGILYLVGACHALGLRTILVSTSSQDVPLLLRHYQVLAYGSDISQVEGLELFRQKLEQYISKVGELDLGNPIKEHFPLDRRPVSRWDYADLENKLRQREEEIQDLRAQLEPLKQSLRLESFRGATPFLISEQGEKGRGEGSRITFRRVPDKAVEHNASDDDETDSGTSPVRSDP